ncbi:MAG: FAD binding domain-containing protein [Candidatus Izemoplasmatales bacterium]|jgi:CO/xanthine dehydrogenase FAD-binding subunit|nr:FAD binding domain-containing protein [Candidatus Izemoplasmatales bacterium]
MVKAYLPKTLEECLKLLNDFDLKVVAGGTDVLIQNRAPSQLPIGYKKDICYILQIDELKKIYEDDQYLYIGSAVSLEEIMDSMIVPEILRKTILEMASPAIRHTATLAGNIANASPAGDSLVTLYLLDSEVEIRSVNHLRRMKVSDFITGVRRIELAKDELISKIIIPKFEFDQAYFKKVGPRLSDAISKVAFAGAYKLEGKKIMDFRVSFGAVNVTVVRDLEIEKKIVSNTVEDIKKMQETIVSWYEKVINPIDDQRSNKAYRKVVALNLLREFIENLNL